MRKVFSLAIAASLVLLLLTGGAQVASAQSKEFEAGKNLHVYYNILHLLNSGYVDSVATEKLVKSSIDGMLSSLDPYTEYLPDEQKEELELMTTASYGGVGSIIKKVDSLGVLITEPYAGSPAVKFGLEPGDVILKIDGVDVKGLSATECSNRMKGQPDTEVTFLVKKGRTGETKEIKLLRERIQIENLSYYDIIETPATTKTTTTADSVAASAAAGSADAAIAATADAGATTTIKTGYIKLDGFTVGLSKQFRKTFNALKDQGIGKLVIDLRGNGGGIMDESVGILSTLLPKGTKVLSQMGRDSSTLVVYKTQEEPVDTLMPVMVLVNSGSASASEILSGALQDLDRAIIAGTKTYGKGLVQTTAPTGYNGYLKYTTAKYYIPSGRCVQAINYSNRNEDGSVGYIPDSLKRAFKTASGRIVYDGGGIDPDIHLVAERYSRPLYSLVMNDVVGDFAIEYYKTHTSIAPAKEFELTDAEYEAFVKFASSREFDPRSTAEIEFEKVVKSAKDEALYEHYKREFEELSSKLKNTKEKVLALLKDEIKPVIEQEIVAKYHYTFGRMASILRSDKVLQQALLKF